MGVKLNTNFAFDAALQLDDGANAKTASGYGFVGGSAYVFDTMAGAPGLGSPAPVENVRYGAVAVVAIAAAPTGTTPVDTVTIQGSNDPAFGSGVVNLGASPALSTAGQSQIVFTNEQNGTIYRYLRASHVISGTTPSFSTVIYLAPINTLNE